MLWFLLACAGSVSGTVDDEAVPGMGSGFWMAVGSGNSQGIMAMSTTVPGACGAFTEFYTAAAEAYDDFFKSFDADQLADDLQAAEEDNLPAEYWVTTIAIDADPDDEADVPDEYNIDDNEAYVSISHKLDYTDWEDVLTDSDAYNSDDWASEDGTIEARSFKEEGGISLKGEADMNNDDGDSAGDIKVKMSVGWCEEAEEAYQDYMSVF